MLSRTFIWKIVVSNIEVIFQEAGTFAEVFLLVGLFPIILYFLLHFCQLQFCSLLAAL